MSARNRTPPAGVSRARHDARPMSAGRPGNPGLETKMHSAGNGVIAGLVATVALTALMMMKAGMGLMPALDPIGMIATMMGISATMGWVVHFLIGAVLWGGAFALLSDHIPGGAFWQKGIMFGVGAWLIMMVVMMPMAGCGFFGMKAGMMAPVMTLVMHVVYGAVLGAVYAMLIGRRASQSV